VRAAGRAIVVTGLIVGTLDILSAFMIALSRGSTVTRLLQFIASGLLGPQAFQGGAGTAVLGLTLHFFIAFTLVAVFYAARRHFGLLQDYAVSSGII
jgi:hypothetical protein